MPAHTNSNGDSFSDRASSVTVPPREHIAPAGGPTAETEPSKERGAPFTHQVSAASGASRGGVKAKLGKGPAVDRTFDPAWEVKWKGPDDPENPYNWSPFRRWYCVILGASLVLNATFASSAPSETIPSYMAKWGISQTVGVLTISLFVAGYCAGPLVWGPLSETYGRRNIFIIAFGPYVCWNIGCALSQNVRSLLVFRFLAGTFAAAPLANAGALIADVIPARKRGVGLSIFSLAPFAGPALGPTVGGFIQVTGTDWRWVYWVLALFATVCFAILILTLPETYTPLLLQRKARQLRKESGDARYWAPLDKKSTKASAVVYTILVKPFKMLIEEPMLFAITLYMSFIYGIIYLMFEALPLVMSGVHKFNSGITGLTFLPLFFGGVITNIIYIFYLGPKYAKLADSMAPRMVPPEERLGQAMFGGMALPIAMFWLGWTGNYESISYWSPIFAVVLLGMSVLMIFQALFNYIIDAYLMAAATALSVNTVFRSAFGAGFPLFANQMFIRLGINWAGTLLGCLALVMMPIPFVLNTFGPKIRAMSKNAPKLPPPHAAAAAAAVPPQQGGGVPLGRGARDVEEDAADAGQEKLRS